MLLRRKTRTYLRPIGAGKSDHRMISIGMSGAIEAGRRSPRAAVARTGDRGARLERVKVQV